MKHATIIHGYKGKPDTNWKPWLKAELEAEGWKVAVPKMPDPEHPIASAWTAKLAETVGEPSTDTYLIGHSLGSITILRYLETLPENQTVGGVILIAGFGERFKRYNNGSHDSFFDHELNWQRIREHCGNFVAIHSEDDPLVEPTQLKLFESKLGARTILMQDMGHFGSADGVFEVPVVRDELVAMVAH